MINLTDHLDRPATIDVSQTYAARTRLCGSSETILATKQLTVSVIRKKNPRRIASTSKDDEEKKETPPNRTDTSPREQSERRTDGDINNPTANCRLIIRCKPWFIKKGSSRDQSPTDGQEKKPTTHSSCRELKR